MRKKLTALILMSILLLSACGSGGARGEGSPAGDQREGQNAEIQDAGVQEELHWKLEETPLPIAPYGSVRTYLDTLSGDALYCVSVGRGSDGEWQEYIQKLEPPYTEWQSFVFLSADWIEGRDCAIQCAALCGDELRIILEDRGPMETQGDGEQEEGEQEDGEQTAEEQEAGWVTAKWSPDTGVSTEPVQSDKIDAEVLDHVTLYYSASDGTSYFVTTTTEGVVSYDSTFENKSTWLDTGHVWQILEDPEDGNVYFCGQAVEGGFRIWTAENHDLVFSSDEVTMTFTGRVVFSGPSEGYLCVPEGIWQFDLKSGEMEELTAFQEEGYFVEQVYGAQINEKGNLLMAAKVMDEEEVGKTNSSGQRVLLERVVDENWRDRKELVLATCGLGTFLSRVVADFNRQEGEYYITLREPGEGEDLMDFNARIKTEIGSGGGPDIVDGILDLYDAAGQGLLRNLEGDLAEEKGLLLPNVRAAGEVNGELFAAPYNFMLGSVVVSSDVVGEKEYWTAEEFMEYVRSSGVETAISRMGPADLFWTLVSHGGLIDWENGTCHLNGDEAVERLEFAKEYGAVSDDFDAAAQSIAEGRTLAEFGVVNSLIYSGASSYENQYQGKEVYIGYPEDDYPDRSGNRVYANYLAVNQACRYPEGAVSFIRYLLSVENQKLLAVPDSGSFPVNAEALEYAFQYARENRDSIEPVTVYPAYGDAYEQGVASEAVMEKVHKALLNARPEGYNVTPVADIILEEAPAYFNGDRSAQDVCNNIQNRVQLYLDETH